MTRDRRLGRGLEALLGRPIEVHGPHAGGFAGAAPADAGEPTLGCPVQLSVHDIDRSPFQPRDDFDDSAIDELADSLNEHGLMQPIVVRRTGERYQLVAGERRLRAAIKAGWLEIPVQIKDVDDRQAAEMAIVENLQRKDLNPLEKAASFQRYLEQYRCTQEDLAGRLHVDRSTVANLIRLLELPEPVRAALRSGQITQGHARALLPLGDEREQAAFAHRIQEEGLSVRATETLVQDAIHAADREPLRVVGADADEPESAAPKRAPRSQHLASLEQEFRRALGTKVDIRQTARGRGRVVVHFKNHDEFERLYDQLCRGGGQSQVG